MISGGESPISYPTQEPTIENVVKGIHLHPIMARSLYIFLGA